MKYMFASDVHVQHFSAGKCWRHTEKKKQKDWYCWEICSIMDPRNDLPKECAAEGS